MKKIYKIPKLLLIAIIFTAPVYAQTGQQTTNNNPQSLKHRFCPPDEMDQEQYNAYRQSVIDQRATGRITLANTYNIPVQLHILRTTGGTGGSTQEEVEAELAAANVKFATLGMEFFQCQPVHYINNTTWYNTVFDFEWESYCGQTTAEYLMANANNVTNVLNIYWVNTDGWNWSVGPSGLANCHDWIIMNNDDIGTDWLLAHEVGHYFNLKHTHQTRKDTANVTIKENITRSIINSCYNCTTEGDLCCDTPADPNDWSGCNVVIGNTDDCPASNYNPDEQNLMSYANGCQVYFSSDQIDRMVYAAVNLRDYLDCPYLSNCNASFTLSGTQVSNYSYQASDFITSTRTINPGVLSAYDAENEITLNVGFTATAGCHFTARLEGCWGPLTYRTGKEPVTAEQAGDFKGKKLQALPNPFNKTLEIKINLPEEKPVTLSLCDVAGRIIKEILYSEKIQQGIFSVEIETGNMLPGVYFLKYSDNEYAETIKMVKTE
ncbi:MAG TPA: zinc-dependent metalloprotease [Bacteroidia bacterium]|nr:zinc-dependent metalloprotease [Bacteroidia bacterium]